MGRFQAELSFRVHLLGGLLNKRIYGHLLSSGARAFNGIFSSYRGVDDLSMKCSEKTEKLDEGLSYWPFYGMELLR